MAIFRRRRAGDPLTVMDATPHEGARPLMAAAMPMSGPGVLRANRMRRYKANQDWQREAWYYFDVVGEFRGPMVWIANAVSQADIHATELDRETGKPTGPADDPRAIAAAAQVLGGASKRAGLLRILALCWQAPGEAWVIVKPRPPLRGRPQPDEWIVLPPSKVKAKGTGADASWVYCDPKTGVDIVIDSNAYLFRVWQPHPAEPLEADSAARPALPVCREIEKCSQTIAGQLVSRLAISGIGLVANELNLPKGDHDTSAMALMDDILSAAETNIQTPGEAAGFVPLLINAPGELIASGGAVAFVHPTTEFVQGLDELREKAVLRLAATLDMPNSVAAGQQAEANHWSAWQVEESTYKIYIEPLLKELGDAITEQWFRPALVAMGMSVDEAERFEIGWDTTAIVARPDDTENLRDLHDRLLISDEYMLAENGVPEDARPTDEEHDRRYLERLVLASPALLSEPGVAEALGLGDLVVSRAPAGSAAPEQPAVEPTAEPRALPATQGEEPEPEPVPDGLVAAAEPIVLRAFEIVGGRLIGQSRENRGQFASVPKHELYQHIRPDPGTGVAHSTIKHHEGVAQSFGMHPDSLLAKLYRYVRDAVNTGEAYDRDQLRKALQ